MNFELKDIESDLRRMLGRVTNQLTSSYDTGRDSVLDTLGLEKKSTVSIDVVPALSVFSAGVVVGAALGVLFAPKRGDELRGDIRHRLDDLRERGEERISDLRSNRIEAVES